MLHDEQIFARQCYAKNRRCKLSRVIPPLGGCATLYVSFTGLLIMLRRIIVEFDSGEFNLRYNNPFSKIDKKIVHP